MTDTPSLVTVSAQIRQTAADRPEHRAFIQDDATLSYRELDSQMAMASVGASQVRKACSGSAARASCKIPDQTSAAVSSMLPLKTNEPAR